MLLVPGGLACVASSLVCCESMTVETGALDGHGGLGLPEFFGEDVVLIVRLRLSTELWCNYVTHTGSLVPVGFCEVVPEGGSRVEGVG